MITKIVLTVVGALMLDVAYGADKTCEPEKYAELPATLSSGRPVIVGSINGVESRFYVDSGAFFSFLSLDFATRLHLNFRLDPTNSRNLGESSSTHAKRTKVDRLSLVGFEGGKPLKDIDFLVVDENFGANLSGKIGQNIVGWADSEYDLANGFIRLFTSYRCGSRPLSYWDSNAAFIKIEPASGLSSHFVGTISVNGKKTKALFDSSFLYSIITRKAAERAGFDPKSEKVTTGQPWVREGKTIQNWSWGFDSIELGGEEIKNARILVADVSYEDLADMVLGLDFFLTHRVYFAKTQKRAYFTRNSDAVFDVRASSPVASTNSPGSTDEPKTAAAFRSRGAALLLKNDLQGALADLEQAVKLDPNDVESLFQRAIVYSRLQKYDLALADMDRTVAMKPQSGEMIANRGQLRFYIKDVAGGIADSEAALKLAPNNSQFAYQVASAYAYAGRYEDAIAVYEQFASKYSQDSALSSAALNEACWLRLTITKEFDAAIADCNASIKAKRGAKNLDSRGATWLAIGHYDKAFVDYKEALELRPKNAYTLYGLGVAEEHLGHKEDAVKHKEEAVALQGSIAEDFKKIGVESP